MLEDSLSATAITRDLKTRFVGQRVVCYPRLDSTMEEAGREAKQGAAEGTVIIADEQTAGRGRLKRAWLSPRGNLAFSLILYPAVSHLPSLIMLASLAVVHGIARATGLKAQIKWPNDILINGRKVCGILIESDTQGNRVNYTIIGIGINVNLRPADYPEIQSFATSLSHELAGEVSRLNLIRCLLAEIERSYLALKAGGSLYEEWRDSLVTLGQNVRVTSGKTVIEGIAESVSRDGTLQIRRPDGALINVVAGDVTLRG